MVDLSDFICLDALISKRTVQGTTIKDSGAWETSHKHSSSSLPLRQTNLIFAIITIALFCVSVALILLFLLFVILPASGKSERIIFIDPKDYGGSQEGHNKSLYLGICNEM